MPASSHCFRGCTSGGVFAAVVNEDHDHTASDEFPVVQLPSGSSCSIAIGTGLAGSQPGSVQRVYS
jgi:hypothetical protein